MCGGYSVMILPTPNLQKFWQKIKKAFWQKVEDLKMEKYFREASKFYKGYFNLKGRLVNEYKEAQASGDFSKSYLKNMDTQHFNQLAEERKVITKKMAKLREEFSKDLSQKYDFEKNIVSNNFQKLLKSGIKFNDRELLEMAERHKDNLTESRILHDYAKNQGYELSNYIPYETAMLNFDNYCRLISSSLSATDSLAMPYVNLEDCEMAGGKYCKASMIPKMEIEVIPKTLEEEIASDIKKQNEISEEKKEAFLIGLKGTEEEKEMFIKKMGIEKESNKSIKDIIKEKIEMLTEEEKADARHMSNYFGNGGEITQKEIDYIESEDYKKAVEERETKE
jgi:hypothetical protein